MSTDNTSNQRQLQNELNQLRSQTDGDDQQDVQTTGYTDQSGKRRAIVGDPDAPFLKTPPFESATVPLLRDLPLLSGTYQFSEPVDVVGRRLLNIWVFFTLLADPPGGGNSHLLSLKPEVFRDTVSDQWFPIAVINPTLTPGTPTAQYGSRTFYAAELRSPGFVSLPAATVVFQTVLTFDVSIYTRFRIGFADAEIAPGSILSLDYSFSD